MFSVWYQVTASRAASSKSRSRRVWETGEICSRLVLWEEFNNWEIVSPDGIESGHFGRKEKWTEQNLLAQAAFHGAMIEWISDDTRIPGTNLRQSLHEWEVIRALYASALERRPIKIADFEPTSDLLGELESTLSG